MSPFSQHPRYPDPPTQRKVHTQTPSQTQTQTHTHREKQRENSDTPSDAHTYVQISQRQMYTCRYLETPRTHTHTHTHTHSYSSQTLSQSSICCLRLTLNTSSNPNMWPLALQQGLESGLRCLEVGENGKLLIYHMTNSTPREVLLLDLVTYQSSPLGRHYCCCRSAAKLCLTPCDPTDCSMPAPLSFTVSRSLLKFMSIESVMLSNHLILCCPLLLLPSIFPIIGGRHKDEQTEC